MVHGLLEGSLGGFFFLGGFVHVQKVKPLMIEFEPVPVSLDSDTTPVGNNYTEDPINT